MTIDRPVILHLTDLHFGYDKDPIQKTARDLALGSLLTALSKCEPDWKPNIVCISGDVGWRGQATDYEAAREWLTKLLGSLNLTAKEVFLCAGNHDIERGVSRTIARPSGASEADDVLSLPIGRQYEDAFQAFIQFANNLGVPPYRLGDAESYLVGERTIAEISICAINSAWFCKADDDKGKLWIGRRHIDALESHGQLRHGDQIVGWKPTVVLMHHPKECLHGDEIHQTGNRPAAFIALARRCDLILSGHAHPKAREADQHAQCAWHLNGSATYAGELYSNGFSLIRVEDDQFVYRSFEYDSGAPSREWRQAVGPNLLGFGAKAASTQVLATRQPGASDLDAYRRAASSDAQKVVETKSRALKPWGNLPRTLPLRVRLHVQGVRPCFRSGEFVTQENEVQIMSLIEATRTSRRTLLLGDLGAGKSTMAARYVIEALDAIPTSLAVYLPASSLSPPHEGAADWTTVREFLESVSAYFNGHISPGEPDLDLVVLLNSRVELAVIADGLDEVHPDRARSILHQLAEVVDHWPNSQVLATGRPVELTGVNYARWQLCTTAPLTDDEKLNFFAGEAIADGQSEEDANAVASAALRTLCSLPDVHSLAVTPLFCRVLFRQLGKFLSGTGLTLGDLLHALVKERLADWAKRDSKASSTASFDLLYPDADSRAALLATVALRLYPRRALPVEEARHILGSLVAAPANVSGAVVVEEALRCFEQSGLVTLDGGFQFALQPFGEFLRGYAHALLATKTPEQAMPTDVQQWRAASFAATMARRLGLTDELRPRLISFVRRLLQETRNVPAASYIIFEFQDPSSAKLYIDELRSLGTRPLWFSFGSPEWQFSARTIAECLRLAGDAGFDWFFNEYLDPGYPYVHYGSAVTERIFEQWAAISIGSLSADSGKRLGSLVRPNIAAGSHQLITIIPYLAVLVPDAFEKKDRLWFCAQLLRTEPFRASAEAQLKAAIVEGGGADVGKVLIQAAETGYEYAKPAACFYLSVFGGRPPLTIIRALVRAERGRGAEPAYNRGLEVLTQRLGPDCMQRLLRWFLFDSDSMLAAGAAIELYGIGERRLPLLGEALLRALHDGGYVAKAEEALGAIVKQYGDGAVAWLASRVESGSHALPRGHSAWWRIFLAGVGHLGREGPTLLALCVAGIGEFLLPRHPEVRHQFSEILTGPDGPAFMGALRDCLQHSNPEIRHGAAMVLVTCCPAGEAKALEEVVRCKSRQRHGSWYEWEQFCLSLAFGPSVISHLRSKLATFPPDAEMLALAILYRNGVKLESAEFERLVDGELKWLLGVDDPSQALQSEAGLRALLELAQGGPLELAPRAAEKLLQRHADKLTPDQYATCVALTVEGAWNSSRLQSELRRMNEDPAYAELITHSSGCLVKRGFPRPLIDLVYSAVNKDPKVWADVIWSELCADWRTSSDAESHGQWILDFMRQFPQHAPSIGQAARRSAFDTRLEQPRAHDAIQWLALLAHEARELTKEETEQAVVRYDPISRSALVALLARLGTVPTNLRRTQSVGMPPLGWDVRPVPLGGPPLAALQECARPSESLHPQLCPTIEETLLEEPLSHDDLKSLAQASRNGILIAGTLAMAYGQMPDVDWACRILGYRPPPVPRDDCMRRFVATWRALLAARQDNEEWRASYASALAIWVGSGSGEVLAFASHLLEIRGRLEPAEVEIVFSGFTQELFDDYHLTAQLSSWLSGETRADVWSAVGVAVEKGLSTLDAQPWDSDRSSPRDAGPFLVLPLLRWKTTGQSDEQSKRVFLRGLRMALMPERANPQRETRREALEDVIPLLSTVPKSFVHEAIRYGQSLEDPATRGLCRLFVLNSTFGSE